MVPAVSLVLPLSCTGSGWGLAPPLPQGPPGRWRWVVLRLSHHSDHVLSSGEATYSRGRPRPVFKSVGQGKEEVRSAALGVVGKHSSSFHKEGREWASRRSQTGFSHLSDGSWGDGLWQAAWLKGPRLLLSLPPPVILGAGRFSFVRPVGALLSACPLLECPIHSHLGVQDTTHPGSKPGTPPRTRLPCHPQVVFPLSQAGGGSRGPWSRGSCLSPEGRNTVAPQPALATRPCPSLHSRWASGSCRWLKGRVGEKLPCSLQAGIPNTNAAHSPLSYS